MLGDAAGARDDLQRALVILEQIAADDPDNREAQRDVAETQVGLSATLEKDGDAASAREHCAAGLAILERLNAVDPASAETRALLASARQRAAELEDARTR